MSLFSTNKNSFLWKKFKSAQSLKLPHLRRALPPFREVPGPLLQDRCTATQNINGIVFPRHHTLKRKGEQENPSHFLRIFSFLLELYWIYQQGGNFFAGFLVFSSELSIFFLRIIAKYSSPQSCFDSARVYIWWELYSTILSSQNTMYQCRTFLTSKQGLKVQSTKRLVLVTNYQQSYDNWWQKSQLIIFWGLFIG